MARILVTGASTGLGLLTATSLAETGHDVILHARHPERVEDADLLHRMHGVIFGDLGDFDQTCHVAREANRFGRMDAVIHNAGVIGGSDLVAVNVVAPFVLTALMRPPARTVVLSSSMHRSGTPATLPRGSPEIVRSATATASSISPRWRWACPEGGPRCSPMRSTPAGCPPGWVGRPRLTT